MDQEDCVFCNIAHHRMSTNAIAEDDDLIIIRDILPKAPVHLLVIPKDHIPSVTDLQPQNADLLGKMIMAGKRAAETEGIAESGYKLIFNVGKHGGQVVPHLHLHLLGGKQLAE